jgi:hypothetical protein
MRLNGVLIMTHQIKNKITELEDRQNLLVTEYNKLLAKKDQLFSAINEVQGALRVLHELDHDHEDQSTDTEST